MADNKTVFPSKVDTWLYPALGLPLLAGPGTALAGLVDGEVAAVVIGVLVTVFMVGLCALVVWPVRYELGESELVVRFGIIRSRIPYANIVAVRPSRS